MGLFHLAQRFAIVLLVALIFIPPAAGWTLSGFSSSPPHGSAVPPGTPVSATCTLSFDSWMAGTTFEKDNTLTLYTDLADPHWTVTRIEKMDNQEPVVEAIPVRQSSQVKLDSWTLSYSNKRFEIDVKLTGSTPDREQTGTITIVKLQELAPGAKPVSGTLIKKEMQVVIPTPVPTLTEVIPATEATPVEYIVITPEPADAGTRKSPSAKTTYTPGPDVALLTGLLIGLVVLAGRVGRKT